MNLNLMTAVDWLCVAFVLGSVILLGAGLSMLLFVSSLVRAADSFVAMFHPLTGTGRGRPLNRY